MRRMTSVAVLLLVGMSPLFGQEADDGEKPAEISPVAESAPADQESAKPVEYQDDKVRNQAYQVGVLMIGGILIAGVGLISLVMIWGNRMRRIARQPLPTVAPRDELWYLKNKKRDQTQNTGEPTAAGEAGE